MHSLNSSYYNVHCVAKVPASEFLDAQLAFAGQSHQYPIGQPARGGGHSQGSLKLVVGRGPSGAGAWKEEGPGYLNVMTGAVEEGMGPR